MNLSKDCNKIIFMLSETTPALSSDEASSDWSDVFKDDSESSDEIDDHQIENDDKLFFPLMHYLIRLRKKRVDDFLYIIDSWTELEFKKRLGLSKNTANLLIDELHRSGFIASHKFGLKPLEPKLCFHIFLSFITTTETLDPIATRFDISISSTFRVIRRVITWLLTKLNDVVKWPNDYNEVKTLSDAFETKTGISNTLGIIDCTHIKIEKPKKAREYCNPKGSFSIILQATVDASLRFTSLYCGEPGSTNCMRVLKKSPLYNTASENTAVMFPYDTFLIGHTGYSSITWILPPFRETKRLTIQEREFNLMHSQARKLSELAFKNLKSRFKRIKYFSVYRNIAFITDTVVAACILHNYCINESDNLPTNE